MTSKRKLPKSFYNDGLGDIIDWIDEEVLIHSDANSLKSRKKLNSNDKCNEAKKLKFGKKIDLYGENDVSSKKSHEPRQLNLDQGDEILQEKVDKKLEDKVRGLVNRLAAQTMPFVTSEFTKLYSTNTRSSVNSALFQIIESSLINKHALSKRKLVAELMLLVSYLEFKITHGIGGPFIHQLINKFEKSCRNNEIEDEDKTLDNILGCIVNLYYVGLISANIVFEMIKRICSNDFKPKSVELLLFIVKSVGFQLRKDNPALMKQFILKAQVCCQKLKESSSIDSRINFMMEALAAIKNNNVSKIGNYGCDIDRDTIESTLKSLIKRTKMPENLHDATYEDILNSQNWYLLENRRDEEEDESAKESVSRPKTSSHLDSKTEARICKALGLNKLTEKTIFGALLRVSDYIEASNIIIGFGLNHCSDAMIVCIQVAVHEKKYNPFYFNLINNLCKFNRKYKIATKFVVQDKIRALGQMQPERVDRLKTLCFELIKSDAIPITILKAVEWANISTSTKEFLVYLLENISDLPPLERTKIMSKSDKKSSFAGAMRTFTNCFLKGCKLFD